MCMYSLLLAAIVPTCCSAISPYAAVNHEKMANKPEMGVVDDLEAGHSAVKAAEE